MTGGERVSAVVNGTSSSPLVPSKQALSMASLFPPWCTHTTPLGSVSVSHDPLLITLRSLFLSFSLGASRKSRVASRNFRFEPRVIHPLTNSTSMTARAHGPVDLDRLNFTSHLSPPDPNLHLITHHSLHQAASPSTVHSFSVLQHPLLDCHSLSTPTCSILGQSLTVESDQSIVKFKNRHGAIFRVCAQHTCRQVATRLRPAGPLWQGQSLRVPPPLWLCPRLLFENFLIGNALGMARSRLSPLL